MNESDADQGPVVLPLEAEEFLSWLAAERGRAPNTLAAYRRDLLAYVRWLGARRRSIGEVVESDVEDYVGSLRAAGKAPASVNRALVVVKGLHRFLASNEMTTADPAADVAAPRIPRACRRRSTSPRSTP